MKFNYQKKDITAEALSEKIGKNLFEKVVKASQNNSVSMFYIDIDAYRGGKLIVTNTEA
jgi:hypothetical protein